MNIYSSLLFLHGHIADARLARSLAEPGLDTTESTGAVDHVSPEGAALPAGPHGAGVDAGSIRGRLSYQSRAPDKCQVRVSPSSSMPAPNTPQRR